MEMRCKVLLSMSCVRYAGGPYQLTARSSAAQTLAVDNVLIGELWLVAGQSVSLLPRPPLAPCAIAALHAISNAACSLHSLSGTVSRAFLRWAYRVMAFMLQCGNVGCRNLADALPVLPMHLAERGAVASRHRAVEGGAICSAGAGHYQCS